MKRFTTILFVSIGVGVLILIRAFEDQLFYDPLLDFFKTDHTILPLPALEKGKLLLHVLFRFLLNTGVSLAILWLLFRKKEIVLFSTIIYAISFIVLGVLFWILLSTSEAGDHMFLFYARRFLIQPLFLFLLAPAFYVQHIQKKRN